MEEQANRAEEGQKVSHQYCNCNKYQCCAKSNSAMLILFWSFILSLILQFLIELTASPLNSFTLLRVQILVPLSVVWAVFLLFYPLAAFLGDVLGRHRFFFCSLITLCLSFLVGIILCGLVSLLLFAGALVVVFIGICICGGTSALLVVCTFVSASANVFQFGSDQLVNLQSEDSTLFIYWYVWVYFIAVGVAKLLFSVLACSLWVIWLISVIPGIVFLVLAISLCFLCSRRIRGWFKKPEIKNPNKIVFKVLKFAAKNKRPPQYCDDELPSRLDVGKSEYNGPFTAEEVENVKVFTKVLCMMLTLCPFFAVELSTHIATPVFNFHLVGDWNVVEGGCNDFGSDLFFGNGLLSTVVVVVLISLCIFLPQSFVSKYTPSMLKRMGLAMLMYFFALLTTISTDTVGHTNNLNATCMFTSDSDSKSNGVVSHPLNLSSASLLIQNIFHGLGLALFYTATYEFIYTQSPCIMRSMIIGIFFAIKGLSQLIFLLVILIPFQYWNISQLFPSCGFAYYLLNIFIAVVGLLMFTLTARRYHYTHVQHHDDEYAQINEDELSASNQVHHNENQQTDVHEHSIENNSLSTEGSFRVRMPGMLSRI